MNGPANTLFMRLAGPMQAWGSNSRSDLRRTDRFPSKSGVLGLLLCAMGVRREDSRVPLASLTSLQMGVRIDRSGTTGWDYHTSGAGYGVRMAAGGIKTTQSTGEIETQVSHREYLYDASFLIALQGDHELVDRCAFALQEPVWPVFLGRKSCVPAEPVFEGIGEFGTVIDALSSVPWRPRIDSIDRRDRSATRMLHTYAEHAPGSAPPKSALQRNDEPVVFGFHGHRARLVVPMQLNVPVGEETQASRERTGWRDPYGPWWRTQRAERLAIDNRLCVFCKAPAEEVQHLDYADVRPETLRSLCRLCHDACTRLEYARGMGRQRIDPCEPNERAAVLAQVRLLLTERRRSRQRELLSDARDVAVDFFEDGPAASSR